MIVFKKFNVWYLLLLIPFISVFAIEYFTPVHADDYNYFKMGNSLSNHVHHYLTWSGRFVSDYFSTLLLSTSSSIVKAFTIATIFTTMIYLITKISYITEKKYNSATFYLQFISLFLIFWITSPNKGEIIFWLVGAANYFVTNFFIVIYLFTLFNYIVNKKNIKILIAVSFFAGCSNENTCWIVLLISIISSLYVYKKENNKVLFVSTALVMLGFSVLIFSPGNFVRAAATKSLTDSSFIERTLFFFYESLPHSLGKIWIPILVSLLLLFSYKKKCKSLDFKLSVFFIILGFLSLFSMVAVSSFPSRTLSGAHLFFTLSTSFSIKNILFSKDKYGITIFGVLSSVALLAYIYTLPEMLYSYITVNNQVKIRNYEVYKGLQQNKDYIVVPKYYFPKTLRAGDSINKFHNPANIAKYFGSKNPIAAHSMTYDFSAVLSGYKYPINHDGISNIYIGKDRFYTGSTIILDVNPSLFKNTDDVYDLMIMSHNGDIEKVTSKEINYIYNMYLVGFKSSFKPNNISKIEYIDAKGKSLTLLSR
ncbi:DUF6056 family protein [Providencia rettgeri]